MNKTGRILTNLLSSLLLIKCNYPQTENNVLAGNVKTDMPILLKTGKHYADIMDGLKQNHRLVELTQKFQKSFQENYHWFVEYMKTVPEGEPLPYTEKMGLSKPEYEEYLQLAENIEIVSSATETLRIFRDGNIISFKGTGRLIVLDSININLEKNIVNFKGYQLKYTDTVKINDDKNGLKSKWFGYKFSFVDPDTISYDDLKDIQNLTNTKFELTIGRLEKNNKTLLDFNGRKINKGKKIIDIRMPLVFE